jgi:hypothetical protein
MRHGTVLSSLPELCKHISSVSFAVLPCAITNLYQYLGNCCYHAFRTELLLGRTIVSPTINVRIYLANQ